MTAADRPLAGRVALVTGASRGVGKGCAIELAAAGAVTYLTGRTPHAGEASLPGSLEETAREIRDAGGDAIAVVCDHRDDARVGAVFEQIDAERGRLDVLVNNAFLVPAELTSGLPFWEAPASNWDDMIDVGTRSAYIASRLAAKRMVAAGRGLIVQISSAGAAEYAWHVAYGVGKAALDRMNADMAHELEPHGVVAVSLWPGLVATERTLIVGERMPDLDLSRAESPRFAGRAIVALARHAGPDRSMEFSGRAVTARLLAERFDFRDIDGRLPDGPLFVRPKGVEGSQPD